MKKNVFLLLAFLLLGCVTVKAQDPYCFLRDFEKEWSNQSLTIPASVKNPGIKDFVLAFCKTYSPKWGGATDQAIYYFKNPKKYLKEIEEGGGPDYVDYAPRNGYFAAGSWGDSDCLEACFWNCTNGHKLFAVDWGKEVDCLYVVTVFYDYNPQTHKLVPNTDLTDRLKKVRLRMAGKSPITYVNLNLPKQGKTIKMENWETEEKASFTFDGTKFPNLK